MEISRQFNLQGKTALVTGASRGLGQGYAFALAKAGATVLCSARNWDGIKETKKQIIEAGGKAEAYQGDFSDLNDINRVMKEIIRNHTKLDILVNNAGNEIPKPFLEVTEKDYDNVMDINMKGLYFTTQAAAKHMVKQQYGKIINIGSLGSHIGLPGSTVYCVSKGGVLQFTRALAVELAPNNIQVNALGPGYFRTALTEPFFKDPQIVEKMKSRIPMGRIGTTEDLMAGVVFLASSGSDYITGQILNIDGGWLAG